MSELQTYKGANWVDVKDSDELVIYDTSKPTVIREADDGMYHLTFKTINLDDATGQEISDVCGTVTPNQIAIPKGSVIGELQPTEDGRGIDIPFLFNEEVVAVVEAVTIPDTVQYAYGVDLGQREEGLIAEGGLIKKDGWIDVMFFRGEKTTLTIEVNNSEYGTVNPALIGFLPTSSLVADSNVLILNEDEPEEQRVTATPNSGYVFQNWTINGDQIGESGNPTMISEATTVVANFVAEPSLLTYEQLVALNDHYEVINTLNGAPSDYYTSLSAAEHIQVQEAPEGETGSVGVLVDGNGNETVIDFYAYSYIISSPDEEHFPSGTWMEQNRPN